MPFIGRDWRSPGEAWVKTESLGWQRMKIIESQLYLTCHQNHSNACSWPPRSHYGQHMEANCGQAMAGGGQAGSSAEHESSGSELGESSAGSSRAGSGPASPTSAPEKNNGARHIHPIAISSPYGRLSAACCAHNSHESASGASSPCKSPSTCATTTTTSTRRPSHCNNCFECHHHNVSHNDAQAMSRSLSRETINTTPHNPACAPRMRYNNSVSDFRNNVSTREFTTNDKASILSSAANNDNQAPPARVQDETSQTRMVVTLTPPEAADQQACELSSKRESNMTESTEPPKSTTEQESHSPASSRSTSPALGVEQTADREAGQQRACVCCCCCPGSQPGVANSHHHLMMDMQSPKTAPHCQISVRTREVAMHNTISEAFYRLDFYNAIHDIRRFNYICKLLHLLITQNLTSLSGCATRVLFTMLEQVAWEVSSNKRNVHVIRNLLVELRDTIKKYYCWGRPIGSSALWQQHFETIERISQIVNGIDLSPPKSDSYKVTFDKLPVEMVREILLRLDDYRDLVNSAQASPVMQTMIDSQSIWQKLCRYHFTEQQLKLALDSGNSIMKKKNTLRGVKYARTTSADGRSSYRNPVAHTTSSASRAAATRRQLEQTAARRGPASAADRRNSSASSSSSGGSSSGSGNTSPAATESYVTSAVKLFDDKQRRSQARANCDNQPSSSRNSAGSRRTSLRAEGTSSKTTTTTTTNRQETSANSCGQSVESQSSASEIDWERVFHQLRKRFDLKEEYADCLLLCRHCRCLFWKSFGHPCIKGEDMRQQPQPPNSSRQYGKSAAVGRAPSAPAAAARNNGQDGLLGAASRRQDQRRPSQDNGPSSSSASMPVSGRPSVASLSRNFDRANVNSGAGRRTDENAQPGGQREGASGANLHNRQALPADRQALNQARQPLNNLNAQLRERNINRQQLPPTGREHDSRREELVPKHVTVTPQAFLKFFSL